MIGVDVGPGHPMSTRIPREPKFAAAVEHAEQSCVHDVRGPVRLIRRAWSTASPLPTDPRPFDRLLRKSRSPMPQQSVRCAEHRGLSDTRGDASMTKRVRTGPPWTFGVYGRRTREGPRQSSTPPCAAPAHPEVLVSVVTTRHASALVVRLDREGKRNAIDAEITAGIDAALGELESDDLLRVGVITGGESVFSAGTDLRVTDRSRLRTDSGGEYGIIRRRRTKPLIAAVEGAALGGGMEIVLSCDLVVASSTARLGLPEVSRGVIAACGGLFRAGRSLPLQVANELLLLGEPIGAERAHQLGFVNRVTEPGGALAEAMRLAERIARNAPVAVRESLLAARASAGIDDDVGWQTSDAAVAIVAASEDASEGPRAFFEGREPRWSGR